MYRHRIKNITSSRHIMGDFYFLHFLKCLSYFGVKIFLSSLRRTHLGDCYFCSHLGGSQLSKLGGGSSAAGQEIPFLSSHPPFPA